MFELLGELLWDSLVASPWWRRIFFFALLGLLFHIGWAVKENLIAWAVVFVVFELMGWFDAWRRATRQ